MAFVRFKDNTCRTVSHEQGVEMFEVQQGIRQGSPAQQEFVKNIHRVYLPWDNSTPEYKEKYPRTDNRPLHKSWVSKYD